MRHSLEVLQVVDPKKPWRQPNCRGVGLEGAVLIAAKRTLSSLAGGCMVLSFFPAI